MNKEQYVSYEVAQLLKDKGFNWGCNAHWYIGEHKTFEISSSTDPINWNEVKTDLDWLSCPTQQMAMRWLREEKGIHIYPIPVTGFNYIVAVYAEQGNEAPNRIVLGNRYNAYEDCIEAALEYVLKNLI